MIHQVEPEQLAPEHGSVAKIFPAPHSSIRLSALLSVALAPTSMLLPVHTVVLGRVMVTTGFVVSVLVEVEVLETVTDRVADFVAPDEVFTVAVRVTRSSGLAGILRPGDYVSLIAVVQPEARWQAISNLSLDGQPAQTATAAPLVTTPVPTAGYGPIIPESPFARVTASGLRVLLVPQTFRYEEVTASGTDSAAGVAVTEARASTSTTAR